MNLFRNIFLILFAISMFGTGSVAKDVYVVFYVTHDGETGHVGIAVDNYLVYVRDVAKEEGTVVYYDSLKSGNLTYFDLWPKKDDIRGMKTFRYVEPEYFRLPASSSEPSITVNSLLHKGIPHKEHRQPDGLVRIKTDAKSDYLLTQFLNQLILEAEPFHAIQNNCADFVESALEYISNKTLDADEWVLLTKTTTPNRLFAEISKWENARVLKHPGSKVNGKFAFERILHPARQNDIVEFQNNKTPYQ